MNIVLFDDPLIRQDLLPFTFTRPVGSLRVGILTIDQKWSHYNKAPCSFQTEAYLQGKFPAASGTALMFINGAVCPDDNLWKAISALSPGESLLHEGRLVAVHGSKPEQTSKAKSYPGPILCIDQVWKIFQHNAEQINADFERITHDRTSARITDPHTRVYHLENIFIEEGVKLKACILNAGTGPIYLAKGSEVQEGAIIRGPFSLGEDSVVNMGAKIRGDTTIGPHCKVGGEISNSVLYGYSNKAHDGFLGNSVIGEWCNLGADTNTSNLKNNYEDVKIWNYRKGGFASTGQMFCGLMMGDHSKCGINTMFNTGTVVGVAANIFGDGFPRTLIPSFAWGGAAGFTTFQMKKVFETATKVMERRKVVLGETDKKILESVFAQTTHERVWEKSS